MYPGVFPKRPPKACASSIAISHEVQEAGVSRRVTSSKDANTGPTAGSASAAALKYRPHMRRFIAEDRSPEITSILPTAVTPRSEPGFRRSIIMEALGRAPTLRAFRVLEEVATKRRPSSNTYQTADI